MPSTTWIPRRFFALNTIKRDTQGSSASNYYDDLSNARAEHRHDKDPKTPPKKNLRVVTNLQNAQVAINQTEGQRDVVASPRSGGAYPFSPAGIPVTSPVRPGFPSYPSVSGPFRLVAKLQAGCCGEAIAAEDLFTKRMLCLKVFKKERKSLSGLERELLAYKRIATSKNWTNGKAFIMELERSMQDDHFLCFAMELMQHDLMEVMMDDPCACRVNARRWSAQISLGIASLHEMGIIHRDIKPENVLVDARGNARIADLGAAYMHSGALHWWGEYSTDLVGTWQYMAPEVIQNKGLPKRDKKSYGIAVDYWALGCLIYELESDDHDTLFNSDMGCAGYLAWRSSHFGVVYPPLQSLNKDAASVITGLLRTAPGYRFGIRDLRRHAYFRTEAGMSEFADTEARALARPINPDFQPHLMRSTYTSDPIFTPVRCSRHSKLGGEADFSRFDWDNPRSGVVVDSSIN